MCTGDAVGRVEGVILQRMSTLCQILPWQARGRWRPLRLVLFIISATGGAFSVIKRMDESRLFLFRRPASLDN